MDIDLRPTRVYQDRLVPTGTRLAGWSALAKTLALFAPVRRPSVVSEHHVRRNRRDDGHWQIFDKRYWPGDSIVDHLGFGLRHETLDLLVLKRAFELIPPSDIVNLVEQAPTGTTARRLWFLFETLTGRTLDLEDAPMVGAVDVLDPERYFTGAAGLSRRHRVRDNLLGTVKFCPVIRRTPALARSLSLGLARKAADTVARTGAPLIARAASFLLLADSRASFEIEGERPPRSRLDRWSRAVRQAGQNTLTLGELVRLHCLLIEDLRFTLPGLRQEGVFLGERDHDGNPLPEFIGARASDLESLIDGLSQADARMRQAGLDAVLHAAATAFAFVYIHPFEDGNGRLHRYLIHHTLAERSFTPPGLVFPISSVMRDRIEEYRRTLQAHSGPLMPFIEWRPTARRNVEVFNDTADLYRYVDCTGEAEFLYRCVERTIESDLPHEIDYLRRHDEAIRRIMEVVEMPDRLAEDLLMFIRQNDGNLAKRRREDEFRKLSDGEVDQVETIVRDAFDGMSPLEDGGRASSDEKVSD